MHFLLSKNSSQLLGLVMVLASACSSTGSQEQSNTNPTVVEPAEKGSPFLFIGTYTRKEGPVEARSEGIYLYEFNRETGAITHAGTAAGITNPSYLSIHPSGQWLYAVSETGGDGSTEGGRVYAYSIDRERKQLNPINQVASEGKYPCYVSTNASGQSVLVANYGGGIAVMPINEEGALQQATAVVQHSGKGPTDRQEGPHAHMIIPGPDQQIYAADLGTDKIYRYLLNDQQLVPAGKPTSTAPGAGPRHLAFHPTQDRAYVINELNGTVEAFRLSQGGMERFQTISTLPANSSGAPASADIHIHPSGKFLYASNRGDHNNIAIYAIGEANGELRLLGHQPTQGKTPRNFVIDPSGTFLLVANQDSHNVVSFRIEEETGMLSEVANTQVPTPVCLKFLED